MDIAKAIGILVVLVVHTGLSLGPVTFFGGMFYMPIFFVLAGMTFSWKPEESFGTFLRKKAKRLLIPYFGYNLFLFLFFFVKDSLLTGQVTGDSFFPLLGILYSRNCLLPMDCATNVYFMQILNAPTWFLTGMFVSYMIFWLMMRAAKGDMRRLFGINSIVLLAAVLFHYFCRILLPWSIDCALYAVSFMLLGKIAANRDLVKKISSKPLWLLGLTAMFLLLSVLNGSVNMSVADYGRSMILYLAAGGAGSLLVCVLALFAEKYTVFLARPLGFLGRHTLPVLCLHLFVYAVIGIFV